MKKALFLAASLFVAAFANAQEENAANAGVKPESGSFSVEVGFCPFQSESVNLENGRLNAAYSINDNWSVRAGLGFGASTTDNGVETKKNTFSFAPGVVYGFAGTEKITPYVGGELVLRKSSEKVADKKTSDIFGFGVQAFTGMNYYFTKNAYVGVEFGIGFNSQKDDESDAKSSEFKAYAQPAVRLGWAF